jgi:TolB protein
MANVASRQPAPNTASKPSKSMEVARASHLQSGASCVANRCVAAASIQSPQRTRKMILSLSLCLSSFLQHPAAAQEPVVKPLPAQQMVALPVQEDLRYAGEVHFGAIRRLTTAGENAEGYLSWGGKQITYQAKFGGRSCDQIYTLDLLSGARKLVSTGSGRTTCSFFMPGDRAILFGSTHAASDDCLPPADYSMGYVWKIYPQFDLYVRDLETWDLQPLAPAPGYDAEAVVSPDGKKIVFTSRREGDLDIYIMNVDGTNITKLTDKLGYDGGPFFSPDSQRIVYRSFYPNTQAETDRYLLLLNQDTIEPMALQLYVMNTDGSNKVQVTDNGAANFGPFFHPDGHNIIYCSNQGSATGREFDLYMIRDDGHNNEQITFCPTFDGFPMFSQDGKNLVFASNRQNASEGDTNLFLAEWLPDAQAVK